MKLSGLQLQSTLQIILFVFVINYSTNVNSQKVAAFKPYGCLEKENISAVKEFDFSSIKETLDVTGGDNKGQAFTFAYQFATSLTPDNSGLWETKENGDKVWYLEISSPDAYTINLIFDKFDLPEGAKLFIYNEDMSEVLGAFTSANNNSQGRLATAPVTGDKVIVEYQEPKDVSYSGEILIGAVNHDYIGINDYVNNLKAGKFGDSGSCEEDISCYDPDDAMDIRRSALKLIVDGTDLCSATLINNTSNDGTPYVISGAHCFDSDETAATALVYFNYETPHCSTDQIEGVKSQTLSGASMVAFAADLDIALILMNDTPGESYRPYYAGWTLDTSPSEPYYCIHHPMGDVKKISQAIESVQAGTFNESGNYPYAQVNDVHWKIAEWYSGVTEGGSSGSALFDANYRFIGTLSGGDAYCGYPYNDYFTRFCKDWDLRSDASEQFENWLDPNGTGAEYVDGYDPYAESEMVRLTNVESDETAGKTRYSGGGYISGHNSLGVELYAEEFTGIKSATLKGVYISPSVSTSSSGQTVDIDIWQGNDVPETLVYTQSDIAMSKLVKNREAYIDFDEDVTVSGNFFVGYEIDYSAASIDSFAVYHSSSDSEKSNNTMLLNYGGEWQLASDFYSIGETSLWIDLLAESITYLETDTQDVDNTKGDLVLFPNPVTGGSSIVYINTNNNYVEKCSIYALDGSMMKQAAIKRNGTQVPVNISSLESGTYLMKFTLQDGSLVIKKLKIY